MREKKPQIGQQNSRRNLKQINLKTFTCIHTIRVHIICIIKILILLLCFYVFYIKLGVTLGLSSGKGVPTDGENRSMIKCLV